MAGVGRGRGRGRRDNVDLGTTFDLYQLSAAVSGGSFSASGGAPPEDTRSVSSDVTESDTEPEDAMTKYARRFVVVGGNDSVGSTDVGSLPESYKLSVQCLSEIEEKEEKDSEKQVRLPQAFPDPDFKLPDEVQIQSFGDFADVGLETTCVAGQVVSPSEFYLASATDFPENLNAFIKGMTDEYHEWRKQPRHDRWMLRGKDGFLKNGGFIACFNPWQPMQKREIVRAKVLSKHSHEEGEEHIYNVLLIDNGMTARVELSDMFFLHEKFVTTPAFATKCRFKLDSFYDQFHSGESEWKKQTNLLLMDVMKNERRLSVKFVRPVDVEGEVIWEVSLLAMDTPHPNIHDRRRIERQVIKRTTGMYVRSKKLKKVPPPWSSTGDSSSVNYE